MGAAGSEVNNAFEDVGAARDQKELDLGAKHSCSMSSALKLRAAALSLVIIAA